MLRTTESWLAIDWA